MSLHLNLLKNLNFLFQIGGESEDIIKRMQDWVWSWGYWSLLSIILLQKFATWWTPNRFLRMWGQYLLFEMCELPAENKGFQAAQGPSPLPPVAIRSGASPVTIWPAIQSLKPEDENFL
jgi:hypothetical protein